MLAYSAFKHVVISTELKAQTELLAWQRTLLSAERPLRRFTISSQSPLLCVVHHLCDEDIDSWVWPLCDNGLINPGRLSLGVAQSSGVAGVPRLGPVEIIAASNRLRILLCLTGKQQQHLACLFPPRLLNHISNDPRWRNLVKPCRCESPWETSQPHQHNAEQIKTTARRPSQAGRGLTPLLHPVWGFRPPSSLCGIRRENNDGGYEDGRLGQALCVITEALRLHRLSFRNTSQLWTLHSSWRLLHHRYSRRYQSDRRGSTLSWSITSECVHWCSFCHT